MSSSSATATASRSPSPITPATPESSDSLDTVAIPNSVDLSSWYNTLSSTKPAPETSTFWDHNADQFVGKEEDVNILSLDDIIQDYAYEDSTPSALASSSEPSSADAALSAGAVVTPVKAETTVPPRPPLPQTKPIPPPASHLRKRPSSAASQTVVYPPKESCTNLPIMIPSIPENGTKSRVETQVRVTVDLAHASSSTGEPFKYDRVGSWKWLKLPQGTATKKRTRKEGKIDPDPEDMLFLNAEVTCASSPQMRVVCCSSCQTREAKRIARKLALRVRPQRSDSETPESGNGAGATEGSFNIVQFNCPDILDFSTGTVALPLRITCYCRHHREKVGFLVHFTMSDHTGRVVGSGTTRPIMITDDHKTTGANKQLSSAGVSPGLDVDWSKAAPQADRTEKPGSGKRKHTHAPDTSDQRKKRVKGSTTSRAAAPKLTRQDSAGSVSPSTNFTSSLPTRTTTPAFANSGPPSQFGTGPSTPPTSDNFIVQHAESFLLSPSTTINSTGENDRPTFEQSTMGRPLHSLADLSPQVLQQTASPLTFLPTAPPSPASIPSEHVQSMQTPMSLQQLPFMFFNSDPPPPVAPLPMPKIHRLIPSSGPSYGGIEVTVLGSNFHLGVQLDCVFGDVVASSTQRWSDNTLVCILPPRVTSGVVAVWFSGLQKDDDGTPPCLFTYTDESDRTLMELALQVVGLKMTGKLEDAKSVAMRIVGPSGNDSQGGSDAGQGMTMMSNSLSYDLGPMLHRTHSGEPLEKMTLELLSLLDLPVETSSVSCSDALSHQTHNGQTLLHIAAFLRYSRIVRFLAQHGIDLDVRDRNGYTALHVAAFVGDKECADILIGAGADVEIVDAKGRTAEEIAPFDFESLRCYGQGYSESSDAELDEEESRWGDAEESEDEPVVRNQITRRVRIHRRSVEPPASSPSDDESVQDPPAGMDMRKEDALPAGVDEKQALTFMNALQRTLAMMQPTQGIIPNMPHLPLPHLPNLPGMPWGALPQIPMVFPVDVPWPAFLIEKRNGDVLGHAQPRGARRALWTPQEWRAFWEKWMIQGAPARDDDEPPPKYTPRATDTSTPVPVEEEAQSEDPVAGPSTAIPAAVERQALRRPTYNADPLPDQEVNAYAYRPIQKPARQMPQKEDRMLVLFWIPILFLALLWAFIHGMRIAFHSVRTMTPLKAILRL